MCYLATIHQNIVIMLAVQILSQEDCEWGLPIWTVQNLHAVSFSHRGIETQFACQKLSVTLKYHFPFWELIFLFWKKVELDVLLNGCFEQLWSSFLA